MKMRVSPSFVVAVMALVLAAGGTGYAAGKVTSKQIKDNTVQGKDVRDGGLTGVDLADGSVSSADLLDRTIAGADVAPGTLTGAHLADGSVAGADLLDGSVTGADLADATVTGTDLATSSVGSAKIADGSVAGVDVANGSIGRTKLNKACAANEANLFGGCVRREAYARSSHQAAIDDCSNRNGRLPTLLELTWIRTHTAEFGWADGNISNYEFSGDYTTSYPFTPIAVDRAGNGIENAIAQLFWHHCVTY